MSYSLKMQNHYNQCVHMNRQWRAIWCFIVTAVLPQCAAGIPQ
jgi:hypothetical protein